MDVQFIPTTLVVTSTVFIHPTASHTFGAGHPSSVPPSHFVPDDSGRLDHFTVFCKIYILTILILFRTVLLGIVPQHRGAFLQMFSSSHI